MHQCMKCTKYGKMDKTRDMIIRGHKRKHDMHDQTKTY